MLGYLRLENVGPAPTMELKLAPRLNLLTSDNGLGKSSLLDVAWWALTRRWPHSPLILVSAAPFFDVEKVAWFDLDLDRESGRVELQRRPFVRHCGVSNWLTSEAFGSTPRSTSWGSPATTD